METDFIPIDYDYFDFEGKNYARIIGRNSTGKRVCVIDSCPVYLWAILKSGVKDSQIKKIEKKIQKIEIILKSRKTRVVKTELHEKNFMGKNVRALKIFATNYKDLHDVASNIDFPEIEVRRGYDLGFITHYIIEKKLEPLKWYKISGEVLNDSYEFGGIDNILDVDFCIKLDSHKEIKDKKFMPKVLSYDIETDEIKIGEGEILMVSLVSGDFKKVITWKKAKKKPGYVEYVKDEAELIMKFNEYVREISPDFLVGYFSDGFDLPYLKARAEKYKIKLSLGLDNSPPRFTRGIQLTGKIFGITHIDILKFIRTAYAQYMKSETLSLNEVAKEFLKDSKKDFEIEHSSNLREDQWDKYYEYNLHDSVLAEGLFWKFWSDLVEFTRVVKEPVFDVSRFGLSKHMESYILHNLDRFNEIPEKKPVHNEIGARRKSGSVKGAFVLEPKPGLYEDVVMFDFTSMHTSIIISYNISRETLLLEKKRGAVASPEVEFEGDRVNFYFDKKGGFFPELLRDIFEMRRKCKQDYKKSPSPMALARSNAFKLLSASAHGYVGFFGARYYSKECSASILGFVRKLNKDTIKMAQDAGFEVIFSDTDSVGFLRGGKTKEEIKKFLKKLNDKLPGVMELELEGFFKRGLWVTTRAGVTGAKKKYALLTEDGELKIRGFETVRRDWCLLAREVQNKVIRKVLRDGNEKNALSFVKKIIGDIKNRGVDKKDLMIRTQLKKPISEYKAISPHVIAAKKMREMDIPVTQGNIISYYIAESEERKKLVREKVKLPVEEGEYDVEYYLDRQILPAVENIFQVFGIDVKGVVNSKGQGKLDKWM